MEAGESELVPSGALKSSNSPSSCLDYPLTSDQASSIAINFNGSYPPMKNLAGSLRANATSDVSDAAIRSGTTVHRSSIFEHTRLRCGGTPLSLPGSTA